MKQLVETLLNRSDETVSKDIEPRDGGDTSDEMDIPFNKCFDELVSAYPRDEKRKFRFNGRATIYKRDEEFVEIKIETLSDTIRFPVRISGYTSRFGKIDAEYISVGGFSVNVYYNIDDSEDDYFLRKLFYYSDVGGVDGEHTGTTSVQPNPDWSRSDNLDGTITVTKQNSRIEVYDWRYNGITTGKPTSKGSRVVFHYSDSLWSGGGREGFYHTFNAKTTLLNDEDVTAQYATVSETGVLKMCYESACEYSSDSYVAYTEVDSNNGWCVEKEDISTVDDASNVVWVNSKEDTWKVGVEKDLIL